MIQKIVCIAVVLAKKSAFNVELVTHLMVFVLIVMIPTAIIALKAELENALHVEHQGPIMIQRQTLALLVLLARRQALES